MDQNRNEQFLEILIAQKKDSHIENLPELYHNDIPHFQLQNKG